ncbi:threonine synthase [Peribacillus deserti]|uniref:Threonine synthase n=1 Tax=Peribacillus deserti TaxID=673318 RepID=A0ABS2QDS0_9BACI|nr:threonine synthase [Peribacillus deserti]MBM7691311.1 threonine synthase [Peribacillus deserti]
MSFSSISHLVCPKCKSTYDDTIVNQLCICGSPLLVEYDLDSLKGKKKNEVINTKRHDLWRYHQLLPVRNPAHVVSLGEGLTPIIPMSNIGAKIGIPQLFMKDEGLVPTGSFKARGAAVGVSKAKELGIKQLAMPTNGNAGAAWSLYSARAGIDSYIIMPVDAPPITRKEVAVSGAHLYLVNGLISDAGKIVGELVKDQGFYDASTLKEPYRIEGKKTMGYELLEQFEDSIPDVILYPTGGGVGLIGIYKAIKEWQELGWIKGNKIPRLVAVQAEGCAPIVKAWQERKTESVFWENSETAAFGINVPKAIGDFLVLDALYQTDGCAIAVTEEDIKKVHRETAQIEGAFICPEGAATFAAAATLRENGWIKEGETVVCLNTGQGIKYPELVETDPPVLERGDSASKIAVSSVLK